MYEDRIVIDPGIRHGKPVIRGTRVPVDIFLDHSYSWIARRRHGN